MNVPEEPEIKCTVKISEKTQTHHKLTPWIDFLGIQMYACHEYIKITINVIIWQ